MQDMPHVVGIDGFLGFVYVMIAVIGFWYGVCQGFRSMKEPLYITLTEEEKDHTPFCNDDWDTICRSAIEGAKDGDHRDRQWVMENVIVGCEETKEVEQPKTDPTIIKEVIATLKSMGHSASEAKKLVMDLASKKVYHKAEELLVDVYKK
tara:strand:- start:1141 stop:1590 length:450 start_codon:yes stop_codon:yes gene_type:complete